MKTTALLAAAFYAFACLAPITAADPRDEARVKQLVQALDTGDRGARIGAIQQLAGYGPKARPATAKLAQLLQSQDQEERLLAAVALARIAPETKGLEPILREALEGDDLRLRGGAVVGLAFLGTPRSEDRRALGPHAGGQELGYGRYGGCGAHADGKTGGRAARRGPRFFEQAGAGIGGPGIGRDWRPGSGG